MDFEKRLFEMARDHKGSLVDRREVDDESNELDSYRVYLPEYGVYDVSKMEDPDTGGVYYLMYSHPDSEEMSACAVGNSLAVGGY